MCEDKPMASWCDKVKESMNTVIAESGVSLDTGFRCKNIIVLSLKITNDFGEAAESM